MFIKTVSTTSGINPIKFDETGGVFYWILNSGSSTIYAQTTAESDARDARKTDIPTSLPANGGNAYTVNGRHAYRIPTLDANANLFDTNAENINDAYLQWDGSKYFKLRTFGENLTAVDYATNAGNADTVDNLHADDFVNANDRDQIQIPSNVDVPAWIYANGKRYQQYMTNDANIGTTNIPNNSTDWVWYWYDGLNILARDYSSGKYYICDMINSYFSGWKDVYTSGNKPYVTGVASAKFGEKVNVSFGFTPSMVLYQPANPASNIPGSIYQATMGVDANGFTPNQATYKQEDSCGFSYIAFK